jgi:uncharacterized membrane protein
MRVLQIVTLLTATLFTGLMSGFFTGISYSFMPGLKRSADRTFIESMQNTNRAILNPWFLVPFVGSIPVLILAEVVALTGEGSVPWITAGLVFYLVAFIITRTVNVPLNNQLDAAGDVADLTDLAGVRARYEDRWVQWNLIRALVHTAAFGCLAVALFVYGGD